MEYCDKVKDLESKIKTLEDKVFKMNLNQKKDKCIIQTNKELEETKTLNEVAKMFKRGWLCKDERCVMWVPHRPKGFPLWNKQKGGVELNVKIKLSQMHDENRACYVDCKTGKEFFKTLLKDVAFRFCGESDILTLTFDKLTNLDEHFLHKCGGFITAEVIPKDNNNILFDKETLKNLAYEINKTSKEWLALMGPIPGSLELVKRATNNKLGL